MVLSNNGLLVQNVLQSRQSYRGNKIESIYLVQMARNPAYTNVIPALAMIYIVTLMLVAHQAEGACSNWHMKFPWTVYYPYGSYWDTCSNVKYNTGIYSISATCTNNGYSYGSEISQTKCCNTCLDPSHERYSRPNADEYMLVNVYGSLSCQDPVSPRPAGCPYNAQTAKATAAKGTKKVSFGRKSEVKVSNTMNPLYRYGPVCASIPLYV